MKSSIIHSAALLASIAALSAFDQASAAAINIDIQVNGSSTTYSGQGVVTTTGTTWNGVNAGNFVNAGPLVDDSGSTTSITLWSEITGNGGAWSYAPVTGNPADTLMGDYGYHTRTSPNLFTLYTPTGSSTGHQLTVGSQWDIYIYSRGDGAGQGGTYQLTQTAGNQTATASGQTWSGTFVENDNYVVFRNVTPTTYAGGVEFRFLMDGNGAGGSGTAIINGIQLVQVPEPSCSLLGAVGFLALCRRRRN